MRFTSYILSMSFTWTPHRFSGGALALDVANSVILRHLPGRSVDRFADPQNLAAFPGAAAEFSAERSLFGALDPVEPSEEPPFLALREAIDRHFRDRVEGHGNPLLLADLLEQIAATLRRSAPQSDRSTDLMTATAHSALRLVVDGGDGRMKICGNCGWLFIDRSKNRSRAWCDMTVCGNRAKARRHYASRNRKEETGT